MKSSPPLCIDLQRGRFAYGFWAIQMFGVVVASMLLPLGLAGVTLTLGAALLWRAWPSRLLLSRMVLRGDGTVVLVGEVDRELVLLQAQRFFSVQLLRFDSGDCLCLWPDMISVCAQRDLQRWLSLHAPATAGSRIAGEGLQP